MKHILFNSFILFSACVFSYCSSGPKENEQAKPENEKTTTVDTSLNGLVGVIEKNPPVQDGDYIKKYPSGIVQLRGYYINGKRNGQWTGFFPDGKIQTEGFYKDGLRDGKAIVYYQSGKIYYTGYYKDGKEVGKWIFYKEDGTVFEEKDHGGE